MALPSPPGTSARRRGLRVATALTAAVLLGGLAAGLVAGPGGPDGAPAAAPPGGHHAGTARPPAPAHPTSTALTTTGTAAGAHGGHHATGIPATPTTAAGSPAAVGHSVDDHGELEVTVVLGEDGETRVKGPVRPGAWFSFVNRTTADQVLTSEDGTITVDVPMVRLVTVRAPTTPGTYRLVSGTDPTVTAQLVVAG